MVKAQDELNSNKQVCLLKYNKRQLDLALSEVARVRGALHKTH